MNRLTAWLNDDRTPRWQVLVAAALTVLASWWVSYDVSRREVNAQIQIQRQEFRQSQISELRSSAQDFNVAAGAYVASILDGGDVTSTRQQLMQSIQKQHAAVELAKTDFSIETQKPAEVYQKRLVELSVVVQSVNKILDMRPFWEKISDVLVARDEFLVSLAAGK